MSELVVDKIRDYLHTLLISLELELFDVQFRREGHGWVLRVFIDSKDGVSLDQCSGVSRELSQYLDVEDLIEHAYNLEVSSPGLERPVRSLDEFQRFCGKKARIKVHEAIDGDKIFEGIIETVESDTVCLAIEGKDVMRFDYAWINKARLAL